MADDIQYPDEFVDRLELIWGEGFLSPGGLVEVKEILSGIDLTGKTVLDIGCGTGGAELVMVQNWKVRRIVGIDVEPQLLERAQQRMDDASVADRVGFQLVTPGPLPFDNSSFDLVFSKDAIIHIPDKDALYRDVLRVLRPTGTFAASDWLVGEGKADLPEWLRYRKLAHLNFSVATEAETASAMKSAGFEKVSTRDRNAWYAPMSALELEQLKGPLRQRILEISDEPIYLNWLEVRRAMSDSVRLGALRPTHLRGYKAGG